MDLDKVYAEVASEVGAELAATQKKNEASVRGTGLSAGEPSDELKAKLVRDALEKHRDAIFGAAVAAVIGRLKPARAKAEAAR